MELQILPERGRVKRVITDLEAHDSDKSSEEMPDNCEQNEGTSHAKIYENVQAQGTEVVV